MDININELKEFERKEGIRVLTLLQGELEKLNHSKMTGEQSRLFILAIIKGVISNMK